MKFGREFQTAGPATEQHWRPGRLKNTRSGTSSQWSSSCSIWPSPRSNFRVPVTTRAAAFNTRWTTASPSEVCDTPSQLYSSCRADRSERRGRAGSGRQQTCSRARLELHTVQTPPDLMQKHHVLCSAGDSLCFNRRLLRRQNKADEGVVWCHASNA